MAPRLIKLNRKPFLASGSVVAWGEKSFGGDCSHVQALLHRIVVVRSCCCQAELVDVAPWMHVRFELSSRKCTSTLKTHDF